MLETLKNEIIEAEKITSKGELPMLIIHNERLLDLMHHTYTRQHIQQITRFLQQQGTFHFPMLSTGLFPAAILSEETAYTGYHHVWVRDNIHTAHAHYVIGAYDVTTRVVTSLLIFFRNHLIRFENIIKGIKSPQDIMERPHIRFDGATLNEVNEQWSHAQNDALGYILWLYCKLVNEHRLEPSYDDVQTLALFPPYFEAIAYWQDEDNGHWEEKAKIEASSIGVVVAGLQALREMLSKRMEIASWLVYDHQPITIEMLDTLIAKGTNALQTILPYECRQTGEQLRRYDSALLFLIYPLHVVDDAMADQIVQDVQSHLLGDYGIRRYRNDSFWAPDYKEMIPPEERTMECADEKSIERDTLIQEGLEAQWCIFDPILSAIFGERFRQTQDKTYLEQQIWHLNRSLGQLTGNESQLGAFKCPELYYLEKGRYVANDATPLLWTQANLRIALHEMERNCT